MARILRDLPYFDDRQAFYREPSGYVVIAPQQVVIRVSIGVYLEHENDFAPTTSSFPALLDTGFNGAFALSQYHLATWTGVATTKLGTEIAKRPGQSPTVREFSYRCFHGRFYIRGNRPKTWEPAGAAYPIRAKIHVLHATEKQLPLPLIGVSALEDHGGKLTIDFSKRLVQL